MMLADRVLTLEEAANFTGVSSATLMRIINIGNGPPVAQLSKRRIGIRQSKLIAWVEECEHRRQDEQAA
jgi:predicted DNA-binding transcriptional regulator AlpA